MARIRSIHPGLFTDEAYMTLSFPARELIKGIWCEADDQGVFEWKPLTLKARIMPADAVDMTALLDELTANRFVSQFGHGGKSYGVIRNFRRYQRPKKPNAAHPLPPEWREYAGIAADSSEPVGSQFGTSGEKSPQMEDGGGRIDPEPSGSEAAAAAPVDLKSEIFGPCLRWLAEHADTTTAKVRPLVGKWCSQHGDAAVLEAMTHAARDSPVDPVSWITDALRRNGTNGRKPARTVESDRRAILKGLRLGPDGRPIDRDNARHPAAAAFGH